MYTEWTFMRVKRDTREMLRYIQKDMSVDKTIEKLIRSFSQEDHI